MKFNLNDVVRVQLTPKGRAIHAANHAMITAFSWSAWQAATRVEREACAKACEESADGFGGHGDWASGYVAALDDIAEGIRARGDA